MEALNIGGNEFENVLFPLVYHHRYFAVEYHEDEHLFTTFLVEGDEAFVEVLKNEPCENPHTDVQKSAAGIITISDKETGRFLYKIRPGSDSSTVFGGIKGQDENQEIRIDDQKIIVGNPDPRVNEPKMTLENSSFSGLAVGIKINEDGSWALGSNFLPPALRP
jgi:hypothetical protein